MSPTPGAEHRLETLLWPLVEDIVETWDVPGIALCVVHHGRVDARGFGSRDRSSGEPVTVGSLFHVASLSKTVVATAVLRLAEAGELDLDAPVTALLPELTWSDPRARDITLTHLLSHHSGIGDVSDYGWHEPEIDDEALGRFAKDVASWPLEHDPGERFAYSNAAYDLLGHLVATRGGRSFEDCLEEDVLQAAGMPTSTFLRSRVPRRLGVAPHLGLPPDVVHGAYPYTRPHAPSSSLHTSATELGRWMTAHLTPDAGLMSATTRERMWRAVGPTGWPGWRGEDWHGQVALGWFRGTYRGHEVVSHTGSDPGFESSLVLLPALGIGVGVLVNGNNAPLLTLTWAAVDTLLGREPAAAPLPPVTVVLGAILRESGVPAAADLHRRLAAQDPATVDLDPDAFADAVWGLVELHRTDAARPVLELWRTVHPESSGAWFMSGWADAVDGLRDRAVDRLRRALVLDPDNDEAASLLERLLGHS